MCVICVIHDGRKGWFDAVQLSHVYSKIMLDLNSVGTIVLNMSRFYIVFFL